jgi:hypothetical protein
LREDNWTASSIVCALKELTEPFTAAVLTQPVTRFVENGNMFEAAEASARAHAYTHMRICAYALWNVAHVKQAIIRNALKHVELLPRFLHDVTRLLSDSIDIAMEHSLLTLLFLRLLCPAIMQPIQYGIDIPSPNDHRLLPNLAKTVLKIITHSRRGPPRTVCAVCAVCAVLR